jgi:hypothetical protein
MVTYRYRVWTNGRERFGAWIESTGYVDSIVYEVVARSFPVRHSPVFPDTTIWEIQLSESRPPCWLPHLCVTLTTCPIAVRLARHDRRRHETLDAISETKLAGMVEHHRDMLDGGWTHNGGGSYLPPGQIYVGEPARAHPS